jgi:hypothetical protein
LEFVFLSPSEKRFWSRRRVLFFTSEPNASGRRVPESEGEKERGGKKATGAAFDFPFDFADTNGCLARREEPVRKKKNARAPRRSSESPKRVPLESAPNRHPVGEPAREKEREGWEKNVTFFLPLRSFRRQARRDETTL